MTPEIKPFTTVEALYDKRNEPTGEMIVDATVWALNNSSTRKAGEIANLVNADQRKLTHALELLVGVTLNEMINEWRMLQARDLCTTSDLPLTKVAHRCGFGSLKGLNGACVARWGVTPNIIRTGKVSPNGHYKLNQEPQKRKTMLDKAKELRRH